MVKGTLFRGFWQSGKVVRQHIQSVSRCLLCENQKPSQVLKRKVTRGWSDIDHNLRRIRRVFSRGRRMLLSQNMAGRQCHYFGEKSAPSIDEKQFFAVQVRLLVVQCAYRFDIAVIDTWSHEAKHQEVVNELPGCKRPMK